jgi:hypothetical protein
MVPALADAADDNFVLHSTWALRDSAHASIRIDAHLTVVDSGLPCDTFNCVCRARLSAAEAANRVRDAIDSFARVKRPFSWWVGPADHPRDLGELLVAAGLERAEGELAMSMDLSMLRLPSRQTDLEIIRATTPGLLAEFAAVNAANWSPPDPQVIGFYDRFAAVLLAEASPQWFYVGYVEGEAVAAAEVTIGSGVAGVYGVSTRAAFRSRGYGTAMTARPLIDARAAGCRTAILQASPDGAGIYARLGFAPFGQITEYKPPPSG